MAELVAERPYSINNSTIVVISVNLIEYGELADCGTVASDSGAIVAAGEVPLARPYGIRHNPIGLRFAHTGIHHDAHIGSAIAVIVILRPVDVVAGGFDGIGHHCPNAFIVAAAIVAAIGGAALGEGVNTVHIELRAIEAVALVVKILIGAGGAARVLRHKGSLAIRHLLVAVFHENNGHLRSAGGGHLGAAHLQRRLGASLSAGAVGHECLTGHFARVLREECALSIAAVGRFVGTNRGYAIGDAIVEVAIGTDSHGFAVAGDEGVMPLIAHHSHRHPRAVALGHGRRLAQSRHGISRAPDAQQRKHNA